MIIHQREVRYGEDYPTFFEALAKVKAYLEQKHPEVSVDLMYKVPIWPEREVGQRFRHATHHLLTMRKSMPIWITMKTIQELFESIIDSLGELPVDQFYRVIQ